MTITPMTDEEIVSRIQAGESDLTESLLRQFGSSPNTGSETGFTVKYSGFILSVASRYYKQSANTLGVDFEDVLQSVALGVLKAAAAYQPDSGKSFRSVAVWFMKREVNNLLGLRDGVPAKLESKTVVGSLDAPLGDDDDSECLADIFHDDRLPAVFDEPENAVVDSDMRSILTAALQKALGALSTDDREALESTGWRRYAIYKKLSNDKHLCRLWADYTGAAYSRHVGVQSFQNSRESEVEEAFFQREKQRSNIISAIGAALRAEASSM